MIYRWNLEQNSTQRISLIQSPTPFLTSKWHRTLYNRTSIEESCIPKGCHVGDVVAVAVAVAAGDGLAAAGDGRCNHVKNSWELHTSFSGRDKAAQTIKGIIRQLCQLLQDTIKEVLIKAGLIVVKLCHHWVRSSWVDCSADHAVDIDYEFGLKLWWGRMEICIQTTEYTSTCIINRVINVSCIAHMFCYTCWTKHWWDPKLACFPGWQTMVDGCCGEGNECQVDFLN